MLTSHARTHSLLCQKIMPGQQVLLPYERMANSRVSTQSKTHTHVDATPNATAHHTHTYTCLLSQSLRLYGFVVPDNPFDIFELNVTMNKEVSRRWRWRHTLQHVYSLAWVGQAANFVRKRNILAQHELRAESFVVCGTPHRLPSCRPANTSP